MSLIVSGNCSRSHRSDSEEPSVRNSPQFSQICAEKKYKEIKNKIQIPLPNHPKTEYPSPPARESHEEMLAQHSKAAMLFTQLLRVFQSRIA